MRTLEDWLATSGIESGAIFWRITKGNKLQADRLSDKAVALIIKQTAQMAELNPAEFAGHSLSSGFATQAAANRAHIKKMMNQAWDSPNTVMGLHSRRRTMVA